MTCLIRWRSGGTSKPGERRLARFDLSMDGLSAIPTRGPGNSAGWEV